MTKYKLYYVAHPYSSNPEANISKVTEYISALQIACPYDTFITPLHVFNFHEGKIPYEETMKHCLKLLSKCEAAIFPHNFEESPGCVAEMNYCKANNIRVHVNNYDEEISEHRELKSR